MIDKSAVIHPTAIIEGDVRIAAGVHIGPYSLIKGDVEIGENCQIDSHVIIKGSTKMGKNNRVFQFASIGEDCQDLKYAGEKTRLEIGDNNVFRESVTLHRGTIQDNSLTKIGSNCLFMVNAHVAHDCIIGNFCIVANNVGLAGHCQVGDNVILGGQVGVHQFCKIGAHAFIGGCAAVNKDIPPFVMAVGNYARPVSVNTEGLLRRGYSKEAVRAIRQAYKLLYRSGNTIDEALEQMQILADTTPEVLPFLEFLKQNGRGIIR